VDGSEGGFAEQLWRFSLKRLRRAGADVRAVIFALKPELFLAEVALLAHLAKNRQERVPVGSAAARCRFPRSADIRAGPKRVPGPYDEAT
jgi:hypothetical protein